jgi:hypothetical protein
MSEFEEEVLKASPQDVEDRECWVLRREDIIETKRMIG